MRGRFVICILTLILLLSACTPSESGQTPAETSSQRTNARSGTDGLLMNFIDGFPDSQIYDQNELIGIISESDCVKQISESRYYNMPMDDATVGKFMTPNVDTIDGNMNVFDAASKFLTSKRRRFPILEDGKLAGQISLKDILKAAMKLKGQTWK